MIRTDGHRGPLLLVLIVLNISYASDVLAEPTASPTGQRPGLIGLGPFFITPRLQLRSLGVDTNVFYTAEDRRTDAIATGGPGVTIVLPLGGRGRLTTEGGLDVLYYVRTRSQRRVSPTFGGSIQAGVSRLRASASYGVVNAYSRRPDVDMRLVSRAETISGRVYYTATQRLGFELGGTLSSDDLTAGQEIPGTNLRAALTREWERADTEVSFRVTPKTSVYVTGDIVEEKYPLDPSRGSGSTRLGLGLRVSSRTLLDADLKAGIRVIRPTDSSLRRHQTMFARGRVTWSIGPRTRLRVDGEDEEILSAFSSADSDQLPVLRLRTMAGRVERSLSRRLDLHVTTARRSMRSASRLRGMALREDTLRRDITWEHGADLGVWLWRIRIGVATIYSDRRSSLKDLGIRGLLVGGTVTFRSD